MLSEYINGGIVKEITLYLKKEEDLSDAINKIGEFINLDLYDMKRIDNAIYFELDDSYVKKFLPDFLREIRDLNIMDLDYDTKINYIENNLDKDLDYVLNNCDDLFKERFRMEDTFSINDSSFYMDVLCYVFYFDGPYENGNFKSLVKYLHKMQRGILKSPLRDALCFGISS